MIIKKLAFGIYREIEPYIVEVIINEGTELDGKMIQQAEEGLLEKYGDMPYVLLVNRVNSYSHTLESIKKTAEMKNMVATAIVVHNTLSRHVAFIHNLFHDNLRVFETRKDALIWLRRFTQTASEDYPKAEPEKQYG